jgi:hypothetical protein
MIKLVIGLAAGALAMEAGCAYAMGGDPWFHAEGSNTSFENFGLGSYFTGGGSTYLNVAPSADRDWGSDPKPAVERQQRAIDQFKTGR